MPETLRQILEKLVSRRDFSSRLEKTGQDEQDKVIGLINLLLAETQGRGEKLLQN